ncbi:MAG: formimidoylglutamate deiminase [Micropruina sp.]|uniref:formimidoylglutamate deiminase n=1 Tax=Micropruina sp. TaxID=2737536 RepID=UPI0039E663D7
MSSYWLEHAWLPAGVADGVVVEDADGRIATVTSGVRRPPAGAETLRGIVLPGLANAHSHAFHRGLRGRTHGDGGTFWTWRERMYALAARLDPDSYRQLATAVYTEMAAAGISCVGEFHYLHHAPGGEPYDEPNAMGLALVDAAAAAGIRITLLDTCYLAGGLDDAGHSPLEGPQRRFGDRDASGWRTRIERLTVTGATPLPGHARLGAAIHSVRGVPADQLPLVASAASDHGLPLHVHLSEQPAENEAARAHYGCTPAELLARSGALGPHTTAVHAIHLTDTDIELLGATRTAICACPTTEADLADGIGPFPALQAAGSPLCLGSDQHVAIDLLGEARRLEQHQRLASGRRGTFAPDELVGVATETGHRALGWDDAGRIEPGARTDLVAIDLASPRTAGADPAQIAMCAAASDVTDVIVDGQPVVRDRQHRLGNVGALLAEVVSVRGC